MAKKKRDYENEYAKYQGTEEQKKNRAARNKARRQLMREGKVHKGDGKDVAHKKALSKGGGNSRSNWKVEKAGNNRAFSRNSNGSMRSERSRSGR